MTAIAVAATKMLSTGVATSRAQRRTSAYPATRDDEPLPAAGLERRRQARRAAVAVVDQGDGDDADGRAGGRDREVRQVWAGGALGGRERRVPVLELRAEALIRAGDVAGGAASVEVGDVGGEERSGHRAGRRHLRRGRVRLVVIAVGRVGTRRGSRRPTWSGRRAWDVVFSGPGVGGDA